METGFLELVLLEPIGAGGVADLHSIFPDQSPGRSGAQPLHRDFLPQFSVIGKQERQVEKNTDKRRKNSREKT